MVGGVEVMGDDDMFISTQKEPYISMADDIRVHDEPHRIRQIQEILSAPMSRELVATN